MDSVRPVNDFICFKQRSTGTDFYVSFSEIISYSWYKPEECYYVSFRTQCFYDSTLNNFVDTILVDENPQETIKKYLLKGKLE